MAKEKKKSIVLTTPPGFLRWPKINEVNYGSEKFPVKEGNFETEIIIDTTHPEWAGFIASIEQHYPAARMLAEQKFSELKVDARKELEKKGGISLRPVFSVMYDEKTEEVLPTVKAKFKMRAGGIIKKGPKAGQTWMMRPKAFDAKGKPIPLFLDVPGSPQHGKPHPKAPKIWGGTKARVAFELDYNQDGSLGYFVALDGKYGLTTSLRAVQVLALATSQAATAEQFGFGSADEGFDYDDTESTWEAETTNEVTDTETASASAQLNGNF